MVEEEDNEEELEEVNIIFFPTLNNYFLPWLFWNNTRAYSKLL